MSSKERIRSRAVNLPIAICFSIAASPSLHDIKAGKVEYRLDKTAIIHCPIGKVSFGQQKLQENLSALMDAINKAKPAAAKGTYVRSLYLSNTMGPSVRVNPLKF